MLKSDTQHDANFEQVGKFRRNEKLDVIAIKHHWNIVVQFYPNHATGGLAVLWP